MSSGFKSTMRSLENSHLKKLGALAGSNIDLSATHFVVIASLLNIGLYNQSLLVFVANSLDWFSMPSLRALIAVFTVVFMFTAVILFVLVIVSRRLTHLVVAVLALGSTFGSYFVAQYSVILDLKMLGNVLNTRLSESSEFVSESMLLHLVLYAVIPIGLLYRVRIRQVNRVRLIVCINIVLIAGCTTLYCLSSSWLWVDKNSKVLGGMIMPWSFVVNSARHYAAISRDSDTQMLLPAATHSNQEKTVVVLVVGETARAQNFSLYNYAKNTNPKLSVLNVVPLKNAQSCTTYTTGSIQCMLGHSDSSSENSHYEPLPSYLYRHGVDVIWNTNNWGEPKIEVTSYSTSKQLRKSCQGIGCKFDEVLLTGLEERISSSKESKVLVVLHQKGSHGPSYHERYPEEYEVFKPVCKSVQLDKCSGDELVNAYNNTILYTDHFLASVIGLLERLSVQKTVMMYMSDHGESLGEYGLYLHGSPYMVAPDVQKNVPFIVWMSEEFQRSENISVESLTKVEKHSQYQIFHSVLGALGVQSDVYKPQLNIFSGGQRVAVTD